MADETRLIALIGPTATGKSAVALRLAEQLDADIVSIDSMQVYRGMDIGTAKPTADEQARVKHHLIDVAGPDETFAVARFVDIADKLIAAAHDTSRRLILVGGTPLYYKALFDGLFEGPSADPAIRQRLMQESPVTLHARLASIDATAATRIHLNDQRRIVRALEVFELTGQSISALQTEWASGTRRHDAFWFGLNLETSSLNRRINARVGQMLQAGWVEEVQKLLEEFGSLSQTAAGATGYSLLIDHLQARATLDDAVEAIKISTRQLARRQIKWFRRFPDVQWLDASATTEALFNQIAAKIV